MQYTTTYTSPIGKMNLTCDETGLTGLWFEGETGYAGGLDKKCQFRQMSVLAFLCINFSISKQVCIFGYKKWCI